MTMVRLTTPMLDAISTALAVALAGDGFNGGDFDGEDREHYQRALTWVWQEQLRREKRRESNNRPEAHRPRG